MSNYIDEDTLDGEDDDCFGYVEYDSDITDVFGERYNDLEYAEGDVIPDVPRIFKKVINRRK